jgi:hypothetical protein
MFISCGKSKKSKPSEEGRRQPKPSPFANPFTDNPLSRAKAKANRIKCVNNLSSIGKAILGFWQDNGARTPWNLIPRQSANHFGESMGPTSVGNVFGLTAIKAELQTAKIIVSPCDTSRQRANEKIQENWRSYNTRENKPVPHDGLSYGLCLGGDFQRPATVIAMTRNLSSDDLAKANWGGGSDKRRRMSGLKPGQGQLVLADGSARQSTNADLDAQGAERNIITMHINARGGTSPRGPSNTKVMLPY